MTAFVSEGMKRSFPVTLMLIAVSAALLMSVAAPYLADPGTVRLTGGSAMFTDSAAARNGMGTIPGLIYGIGDAVCHQMPSRSLFLNGNQMPICMRDMCILAGTAIGLALCILGERTASSKRMTVIATVLFLSVIIDWTVQYITGFDSAASRAVTGTAGGFGLAIFIGNSAYRMYDDASEMHGAEDK